MVRESLNFVHMLSNSPPVRRFLKSRARADHDLEVSDGWGSDFHRDRTCLEERRQPTADPETELSSLSEEASVHFVRWSQPEAIPGLRWSNSWQGWDFLETSFQRQPFRLGLAHGFRLLERHRCPFMRGQLLDGTDRVPGGT